ncbi:molecular chaperone HtpG, partial [Candidatus Methanarcanum hacksteinii]|uniref:molecular chaperone HtpG n=1 Tax=Candidatus Methanarcanum hacksteinii TaxID=2911857 RepID=UPI0037DCD130
KMNFKAMTDESLGLSKKDFRIDVVIDKDARTITVKDNGIGMTQDEMEKNLGVIAHSGSLDFKNENGDKKGADSIIGQFGVGFYSAFMVSDKVTVVSRPVGSDVAYRWESSGADGYSITECEKDSYGTDVIMHIKPDEKDEEYSEFLESYRIQELITMYSDYVRWPIHMMVEEGEWKETGEKDEKGNPKREYVTKEVDKVINSMVPIWQKNKKSATDEKCKEFYKTKFHDFEDPISVIRMNAEGLVSYKAMLFIPKRAPYDFYSRDYEPGLQLYSNGVLIMDKCADLLPFCFRFVKGVVDSQDFSLNISREVLQHDSQLKAIGENLKKKVKAELLRIMKDEPETYREFYKSFGRQLKYGVVEDYGRNREFLQDVLMFTSSEKDELISLDQYVDAMPEGQSNIYYVTGESVQQAKNMPQTEQVRDKGYDILVLTEDVDEFVMKTLAEYREKRMCNVTSDDLGLETEEEKKDAEQKEEEYKGLLDFAKEALDGKVSSVRISHKLKNHAVLLTSEGHITLEMEKYFAEMPGSEDEKMKAQRVLELNASHPAFNALNDAFLNDKEKAKDLIKIMYAQASIMAGLPLDDAVGYSDLVFKLF